MSGDDQVMTSSEACVAEEKEQQSSSNTDSKTSPCSTLSKKDRKRLKKLQKKVHGIQTSCERSGLLTRHEVKEYQRLAAYADDTGTKETVTGTKTEADDTSMITTQPSIRLRTKKRETIETTEGTHHRNLITWVLNEFVEQKKQQESEEDGKNDGNQANEDQESNKNKKKSKKRPRDDSNKTAIPHWVSLHNSGAIEQLAVLQVQIPVLDKDDKEDPLEPYRQVLKNCGSNHATDDNKNGASPSQEPQQQGCSSVGLRCKWFQDKAPKSMSESLLFFSSNTDDKESKKTKVDTTAPITQQELLERMQTLLLTEEEMANEGYPQPIPKSEDELLMDSMAYPGGICIQRTATISDPSSLPPGSAEEFIRVHGRRVKEQDKEDIQRYMETTSMNDDANTPPRLFGLDCEMVMTKLGLELARITILQFDEFIPSESNKDNNGSKKSKHDFTTKTTIILDCLVKPNNPVLDYLTKHSGITAKLLEPVTTTLAQVQYALAHFLTPNDILVGHSLENDLKALHYIHPRVIDTAMVFRPSHKRTKFSLRHLSACLLRRTIQTGSHCSEEDAKATLDLALKKTWLGDELRTPGVGDYDKVSILKTLCPTLSNGSCTGGAVFIGPSSWLEAHITNQPVSAHALSFDGLKDCQKALMSWMSGRRKAQLVWSHVTLPKENCMDATLNSFRSMIDDLLDKLPTGCILAVALQYGLTETQAAYKQRGACLDARSTMGWSDENENRWKETLNGTRYGFIQWFA